MDPTLFLSNQAFQHKDISQPNPDDIDAFYDRHGLDLFAVVARWRTRLNAAWQSRSARRSRPVRLAPKAYRG